MDQLVLTLTLVAVGVCAPDDALIRALSHPEYRARTWAEAVLQGRASEGVYPPTMFAVSAALRTTPDPEIRARLFRVLDRSADDRRPAGYAAADALTGGDYPCVDGLWWTPARGYDLAHPLAARYGLGNLHDAPPLPRRPDQPYAAYRAKTRKLVAAALVAGEDPLAVLEAFDPLWAADAWYAAVHDLPYAGPPAVYVLTVCRWDHPGRARAAAPAPTPIPQPMPAPAR